MTGNTLSSLNQTQSQDGRCLRLHHTCTRRRAVRALVLGRAIRMACTSREPWPGHRAWRQLRHYDPDHDNHTHKTGRNIRMRCIHRGSMRIWTMTMKRYSQILCPSASLGCLKDTHGGSDLTGRTKTSSTRTDTQSNYHHTHDIQRKVLKKRHFLCRLLCTAEHLSLARILECH